MLNVTTTQQHIDLDEGNTQTLHCKVNFTEAFDVWTFWLFNGDLIEAKLLHKARHDKPLSNTVKEHILSLKLKHARLAQSGTYTCGANSSSVLSAQDISARVHDVLGPKLEQTLSTVEVESGRNATLSCVGVYPVASYVDTFWIFNGSRIQSNSKYGVNNGWFERTEENIKIKRLSLTIYNAGLSDNGEYTCVLNTSHGVRLKNVRVNVITTINGKWMLSYPG